LSRERTRGGFHLGVEAGRDVGLPLILGLGIWTFIAVTSGRPMAWNDPRYWPTTIGAAFVLGFLMKGRTGRTGLLVAASGPFVGAGMSILHVREPALLAIAPVVLLMFGGAGALSAGAGAAVRGTVDRLALGRLFPRKIFGEKALGICHDLLPTGVPGCALEWQPLDENQASKSGPSWKRRTIGGSRDA